MKTELLVLLCILLIPAAIAEVECSKVFVVKFNYDNGIITYRDRVIKCGYAPDRRIQPEEGYTAEMISVDDEVLYSFKFDVPLDFNFDFSDPIVKSLSGGMLILNETDFALIFPYYDKVKSIVIYNSRDYKVATIPLIEERFIQQRSFWWVLVLIVFLLVVGYMVYRYYKTKSRSAKKLINRV